MSIYVIGDLHLSFSTDKPMDIFGKNWENHSEKIKQNWINTEREQQNSTDYLIPKISNLCLQLHILPIHIRLLIRIYYYRVTVICSTKARLHSAVT